MADENYQQYGVVPGQDQVNPYQQPIAQPVAQPYQPVDPAQAAQVAQPYQPVDPTQMAQVAQPVAQPYQPANPAQVAQVAQPVAQSYQPVDPTQAAQVAQPVAQPYQPVDATGQAYQQPVAQPYQQAAYQQPVYPAAVTPVDDISKVLIIVSVVEIIIAGGVLALIPLAMAFNYKKACKAGLAEEAAKKKRNTIIALVIVGVLGLLANIFVLSGALS